MIDAIAQLLQGSQGRRIRDPGSRTDRRPDQCGHDNFRFGAATIRRNSRNWGCRSSQPRPRKTAQRQNERRELHHDPSVAHAAGRKARREAGCGERRRRNHARQYADCVHGAIPAMTIIPGSTTGQWC